MEQGRQSREHTGGVTVQRETLEPDQPAARGDALADARAVSSHGESTVLWAASRRIADRMGRGRAAHRNRGSVAAAALGSAGDHAVRGSSAIAGPWCPRWSKQSDRRRPRPHQDEERITRFTYFHANSPEQIRFNRGRRQCLLQSVAAPGGSILSSAALLQGRLQ